MSRLLRLAMAISSNENSDDDAERMKKFMFLEDELFDTPNDYIEKQPCKTSVLIGPMWIDELLKGHPMRIWENLKIRKSTFIALYERLLETRCWVDKKQQKIDVRESLAIFLNAVSWNNKHTDLVKRFQHSTKTTSRHVKKMSWILVKLAPQLIRPRYVDTVQPKIRNDKRFYPWFQDCIGAIDRTCVLAFAKGKRQATYRNRKLAICQNVLAIVDMDMRFTFVHSRWEGSAHDGQVFINATTHQELGFPHPPEGKFYLVNAEYANQPGYLAPYRGENYHRDQFVSHTHYRGPRELFNHRHSSCRNVVERTFGVLKRWYEILRGPMPPYKTARQGTLVLACCVVHNFIRENDIQDEYFLMHDDVDDVPYQAKEGDVSVETEPPRFPQPPAAIVEMNTWVAFLDTIADELWTSVTR